EVKKPSIGMGFHEVLLWARRLREKEFENYRDAFRKYDEDGSNSIDMSELQKVIKELGYTMTKATILEIKQAAFARTETWKTFAPRPPRKCWTQTRWITTPLCTS
ncbi:unnamed protein product, partial [Effrenium voratum]